MKTLSSESKSGVSDDMTETTTIHEKYQQEQCLSRLLSAVVRAAGVPSTHSPIKTIDQEGHLCRSDDDGAVTDRRPGEAPILKPFARKHHPAAVPCEKPQPITAPAPEDEDITAIGIGRQRFGNERAQSVDALAKVDGAGGDHDLQVGAQADHALARTAIRTLASAARSTRLLTRMRTPCSSSTIEPLLDSGASFAGSHVAIKSADTASAVMSGTNDIAPSLARSRATRRQ